MSGECMACDLGRSCPGHNPSRACGCVEGEACTACVGRAVLVLVKDGWREGLLRQAETRFAEGDVWTRAYWLPYVDADAERVGAWRALVPALMGAV